MHAKRIFGVNGIRSMLKFIGKTIRFVFYFLIAFFGLAMFSGLINLLLWEGEPEMPPLEKEDFSEYVMVEDNLNPGDSLGYVRNYRVWRSFDREIYEGEYLISDLEMNRSRAHRNNIMNDWGPGTPYNLFFSQNRTLYDENRNIFHWTWIYQTILKHDKPLLGSLYTMFDSIHAENNPDRSQFADIIVTNVQHLPYHLVHAKTCTEYYADDPNCEGFRCQYHREGNPCIPEISYGLFTPVEFSYNLTGDCDTRTALLMLILDHYGYDVKMLYSYEYGHAVLGINIPATGYYVMWEGKKYYLWETTNKGWLVGQIATEYQNMDYWVALGSRF